MATRLPLGGMVLAGLRAVRLRGRLLIALYAVQLVVSLLFTMGVALALEARFGVHPLFTRGIGGDDAALISALMAQPGLRDFVYLGLAVVLGYALLSLYLNAGLLGAFAGQPFGDAAGRKFFVFLRLWLLALIPWTVAGVVCAIGIDFVDLGMEDLLTQRLMVGRPLVGLIPGLMLLVLTSSAVDYARARLIVKGGGALRALGFGFARTIGRPVTLLHLGLFGLVWIGISALYVVGTYGVAFAGAGGAVTLFVLRQVMCIVRFVARAATSAGQLRALEVEVLETRQVGERPEAAADVGGGQLTQPIE